jgi:hypothetical protein
MRAELHAAPVHIASPPQLTTTTTTITVTMKTDITQPAAAHFNSQRTTESEVQFCSSPSTQISTQPGKMMAMSISPDDGPSANRQPAERIRGGCFPLPVSSILLVEQLWAVADPNNLTGRRHVLHHSYTVLLLSQRHRPVDRPKSYTVDIGGPTKIVDRSRTYSYLHPGHLYAKSETRSDIRTL